MFGHSTSAAKVASANFGPIEALGIPRPTFGLILEEGKQLCGSMQAWLQQTMQDDREALKLAAYQAEGEIKRDEEAGDAEKKPISLEAHAHTIGVILETEGIGTKGERLFRYTNRYPESTAIAQGLAPDSLWAEVVALRDRPLFASAGVSTDTLFAAGITDTVFASPLPVLINESMGTLQSQSFEWNVQVREGTMHIYSFNVDSSLLLSGLVSVSTFEEVSVALRNAEGLLLGHTVVNGSSQPGGGGVLNQTLLPGQYTVSVYGKASVDGTAISVGIGGKLSPASGSSIAGTVELNGVQTKTTLRRFVLDEHGNLTTKDSETGKEITIESDTETWVVIHGRIDNPKSGKMEALSKALLEYVGERGGQVLTLDWSEGASDIFKPFNVDVGDLGDSRWNIPTGEWLAHELLHIGISPDQTNLVLHSHATFLGFFAGEAILKQTGSPVRTVVALDAPKNEVWILDGTPRAADVDFSKVSSVSLAFDSSALGSAKRAATATYSFLVTPEQTGFTEEELEHSLGATAFANIVHATAVGDTSPVMNALSLDVLLNGGYEKFDKDILVGDERIYGKVYEGQIIARTTEKSEGDDHWLDGVPITLQYEKAGTDVRVRDSYTGLHMEIDPTKPIIPLALNTPIQSWVGEVNPLNAYTFTLTEERTIQLAFALPKPDSVLQFHIVPTENTLPLQPYESGTIYSSSTKEATLGPGTYTLYISVLGPSQNLAFDSPENADVPYTLIIS